MQTKDSSIFFTTRIQYMVATYINAHTLYMCRKMGNGFQTPDFHIVKIEISEVYAFSVLPIHRQYY